MPTNRNNHHTPSPLVQIRDLSKRYTSGDRELIVLDSVNLDIYAGEFFILLGSSGSGKSTLLNLISGIDQPDSGTVQINDSPITTLNERQRTLFRREHIGIVFQFFNLIPTLTVLENVTLPHELRGANRHRSEQQARAMLERVGLADRGHDFPDKLSGGQQQRVAIARALVHEPLLVLADEPTGNLDDDTGQSVISLLLELTREAGKTLVMATHDSALTPQADRIGHVQHGRLQIDPVHPTESVRPQARS